MANDVRISAGDTNQPLSATELVVAELWREVLQTAELPGAADNFFSLGGNSMAMVVVEYRIKEELSVELPAGAVLGAPTLRALSGLVDATRGDPRSLGTPSAEKGGA